MKNDKLSFEEYFERMQKELNNMSAEEFFKMIEVDVRDLENE